MSMRDRAGPLIRRLHEAMAPMLQDHTRSIELGLTASEARVIHAALVELEKGDPGWLPIATMPDARPWDIRDDELSEVSLARDASTGEPLYFVLQEKDADGVYEHTQWRPAVVWPKAPGRHPSATSPA